MRHSYPKFMPLLITLLLLLTPSAQAQDEPSPYEIAVQRIEETRLSGATELELSGLGLTELPPEIGLLDELEWLSLHNNELHELPAEIFYLSNLLGLNLIHNQLMELPSEIGQLTDLQGLSISHNQLSELPAEIGQLTNLQYLNVTENVLNSIPPEIGNLHSLQQLLLYNNRLTALPPEIGRLTNLCLLDVQNNNIRHLPVEIGQLHNLTSTDCRDTHQLFVRNNPLISPPPEVVEQGTEAILAYLRNQAWYHTQRLILGAAGGVSLLVLLILGFRLKQQSQRKEKPKRDTV